MSRSNNDEGGFDLNQLLTNLVMGGVREAVGEATSPIAETISTSLQSAGTVLVTVGTITVLIGIVVIGVVVMALREQNASPVKTGWSMAAVIFALIGAIIAVVAGIGSLVLSGQAFGLANEFSRDRSTNNK